MVGRGGAIPSAQRAEDDDECNHEHDYDEADGDPGQRQHGEDGDGDHNRCRDGQRPVGGGRDRDRVTTGRRQVMARAEPSAYFARTRSGRTSFFV